MGQAVKRQYDNSRREAQLRASKAGVVEAARRLFIERGYVATSIESIGEAAGMPLATLYRLFGSKRGILNAVLEVSFVGDDEPVALHDRPSAQAAYAEGDPRGVIAGFAHVCREVADRSAPMHQVLRSAAAVDEEAAQLLGEINRQRLEGQTRVARLLAKRRALAPGLSVKDAADVIYTLMSPDVHRLLTQERGWSSDRYEAWLATTLANALLAQ